MENNLDLFEVEYKDGKLNVQRHLVASQTIYRVLFSDKRNPLVILPGRLQIMLNIGGLLYLKEGKKKRTR